MPNKWVYIVIVEADVDDFVALVPDLPEVKSWVLWPAAARTGIKHMIDAAILRRVKYKIELNPPLYSSDHEDSRRITVPSRIARRAEDYSKMRTAESKSAPDRVVRLAPIGCEAEQPA